MGTQRNNDYKSILEDSEHGPNHPSRSGTFFMVCVNGKQIKRNLAVQPNSYVPSLFLILHFAKNKFFSNDMLQSLTKRCQCKFFFLEISNHRFSCYFKLRSLYVQYFWILLLKLKSRQCFIVLQ